MTAICFMQRFNLTTFETGLYNNKKNTMQPTLEKSKATAMLCQISASAPSTVYIVQTNFLDYVHKHLFI